MPHIEPLDRAAITDPELLALMARAIKRFDMRHYAACI